MSFDTPLFRIEGSGGIRNGKQRYRDWDSDDYPFICRLRSSMAFIPQLDCGFFMVDSYGLFIWRNTEKKV